MASSLTLPVVPDTNPVDILYSSANLMTHKINPATSIVIEQYLQLGLERRLRRYELIRDVMNSWDKDNMNCVLVLPCDVPGNDRDLDITAVPRGDVPPYSFTLQLHHCAKVGKWNKRYITLLENGQMFSSKKPGVGPADKDSTTLCHMSDFDIYTPTENQMRKVLKPPKKYCYAVKSQQKTSVFPTGENFAHFFCAEDAAVAHKFHEFVHAWRSWYLVNRRLEVQKKATKVLAQNISGDVSQKHAAKKSISISQKGSHRVRVSVDETPYTIGQFQPLLDLQRFEKPIDQFGKDLLPESQPTMHRAKEIPRPNRLSREPPPAAYTRTMSMKSQTLIQPSGSEFDSRGLLGKDYDAKLEQQKRESLQRQVVGGVAKANVDGPFTEGPNLLNGGAAAPSQATTSPPRPEPKPWFPSALEHTAKVRATQPPPQRPETSDGFLQRSNTTRRAPPPGHVPYRPLVNLSSDRLDQKSWRDQRIVGHAVHAPAGVPLVDLATGRNQPNRIHPPPSKRDSFRPGGPMIDSYGPPSARTGPPPASYGGSRNRGQSSASVQQQQQQQQRGGGRRFEHEAAPPMPSLPSRGMPRDGVVPLPSRDERDGGYAGFGGRGLPPGHGPPLAMRGRSGTMRY